MPAPIEKPYILHVDDDQDFQSLFYYSFNSTFRIEMAKSAKEGLSLVNEKNFDAVVTDYEMPVMNGIELLKEIKKIKPEMPVIFKTGHGNEELAREAFMNGATDYFTKDVYSFAHKDKFINSINKAIEKRRLDKEKRHTESLLFCSEGRNKAIIESIPDILFILNKDCEFIDFHANLKNLRYNLLLPPEEFIGQNVYNVLPPFLSRLTEEKLKKAIETKELQIYEYSLELDTGRYDFESRMIATSDNEVLAMVRDVTERRKIEDDLNESKMLFQSLVENLPHNVYCKDSEGKYIYANSRYCKTEGWRLEDLIGKTDWDTHPHELARKYINDDKIIIETGKTIEIEEVHQPLDGKPSYVKVIKMPLYDARKQIKGTLGVFWDNTEEVFCKGYTDFLKNVQKSERQLCKVFINEKEEKQLLEKLCHILTDNKICLTSRSVMLKNDGSVEPEYIVSSGFSDDYAFEDDEKFVSGLLGKPDLLKKFQSEKFVLSGNGFFIPFTIDEQLSGFFEMELPGHFIYLDDLADFTVNLSENLSSCLNNIRAEKSQTYRVADELHEYNHIMSIINNAPFGAHIYELKPDNRLVFIGANTAADRILGINNSIFIGKTIEEAFPDLTSTDIPDLYRKVALTGEIHNREQIHYEEGGILGAYDIYAFQILKNQITVFFIDITERKKFEEALKKSEERLSITLQSVKDAIWDWNPEESVHYWSQHYLGMLGYKQGEIAPSLDNWKYLLHPDDIVAANNALLKCMHNETDIYEAEVRMKKKDESWLWILIRGQVIKRSESGEILRMVGTHTDISERKKMEETLEENRQLLRAIFDSSFELIGLIDLDSRLIDINQTAIDFIGVEKESMLGKYFRETPFWTHCDKEIVKLNDSVNMALKGKMIRFETTHTSENGVCHHIDFSLRPIRNREGKIIFLIAEGRDISEIRRFFNETNEWKRRYELVSSSSGQVVYECNFKTGMITWGGSVKQVLGYEVSELNGTFEEWENLVHPDDKDRVIESLEISEKNDLPFNEEYLFKHKDGHYFPVFDRGYILPDSEGNPESLVGMMQDMTKQRELEKELLAKNRELSEFALKVSHDLKGPLNIILGFLEAIKEDPQLFSEFFDRTISRISNLIDFVDNMLKLSRAGKIIDFKVELDPERIIKTVYEKYSPESPDIKLDFIYPISLIHGDPAGIEQVFSNLIQNSIRYRDPRKSMLIIEAGCCSEENKSIITYKDNGSGIEKENFDKIFQLGFTGSEKKGTGIGLTIVQKIIAAHGGTIRAYSEGKGMGVEFVIEIPK